MAEGLRLVRNFIDRMPIHHKLQERRRIKRKKRPLSEGRTITRNKTHAVYAQDISDDEDTAITEVRPPTPKYLTDLYDYDRSSSSEEISEDGNHMTVVMRKGASDIFKKVLILTSNRVRDAVVEKDKQHKKKPSDISQKVYLAACAREGVVPRQKLVTRLVEETLDARDFLLTSETIRVLSYALTTNMFVNTLDLSGNSVGREGMEYIVSMLDENLTIKELILNNTEIGLYEVMLLTEQLSEDLRITTLELAGNNLDDESATYFAEMLKYNRKLKRLNLSNNSFGEEGGHVLAKTIESNDSIEDLDLSWNHIRRTGAAAWGDTLACNEELLKLDLSWNGFGDEGTISLGEGLEYNKTLLVLNLTSNRIAYDGTKILARALKSNTGLQSLVLSQNPITTQGTSDLVTSVNENENSKLKSLILEGVQVLREVDGVIEEIRERMEDFLFVHSGYVISPDILMLRPQVPCEKKCRSGKK